METKEKEIQKKIVELCNTFGDNDHFIVFHKSGNNVNVALPDGDYVTDEHVSASIAAIIETYLLGKGDEGIARFSEVILDAVEAIIGVSPKAGAKLTSRFAKAALIGMKMTLDKLSEDNDDIDENEDCDGCELIKTCNEEKAIKYRKAHGIPKPKKVRKGGRKVDVN